MRSVALSVLLICVAIFVADWAGNSGEGVAFGVYCVALAAVGLESGDPRVTGEMDVFRKTRQYVQKRKRVGYKKSASLPFDEANTK